MVVRNSNIDISSWDTRQLISFLTKSAKEGEVVYSKPLDSFLRGDARAIYSRTPRSFSQIAHSRFFQKMLRQDRRTSTFA